MRGFEEINKTRYIFTRKYFEYSKTFICVYIGEQKKIRQNYIVTSLMMRRQRGPFNSKSFVYLPSIS